MSSVMSTIMTNLSSVKLWGVISLIIPLVASLTLIYMGAYLIIMALGRDFNTHFYERAAKKSYRNWNYAKYNKHH